MGIPAERVSNGVFPPVDRQLERRAPHALTEAARQRLEFLGACPPGRAPQTVAQLGGLNPDIIFEYNGRR